MDACTGRIVFALLLAITLGSSAHARENKPSHGTVEERQVEALRLALAKPFPAITCPSRPDPGNACIWGKLGYGIAALSLAGSEREIAAGNGEIRDALARFSKLPQELTVAGRADGPLRVRPTDRLMFLTGGLLQRIYFQFREGNVSRSGPLSADNARAIETLMWDHARTACKLSSADPARTWDYPGSENISLLHSTTCWGMAEILTVNLTCAPCTYEDGSTVQQQLKAWTDYLTEYIRQRAKYGGLIEFFSPTYYKYTLQNFYNLADFASAPELRRYASAFLDVWWAQWAEEQVGGWHGGSKTRANATLIENRSVGAQLGWLYFGLGQKAPPGMMVSMVASRYRPPEVVSEIATDVIGRGSYVARSQAGGLLSQVPNGREVDAAAGGVVRYAYVNPGSILALAEIPQLPWERWIPFSRQNRWSGLTLLGVGEPQHIFARPMYTSRKTKSYNDLWGVQSFGTQIVQKISKPLSSNAGRMAVWLSDALQVERKGDWYFVTWGETYAAFRPAFGGIVADGKPDIVIMNVDTAPVIIQTAAKSEYPSQQAFEEAVRSAPLDVQHEYIRFRGLGKARTITFYYRSDRVPEIDGQPIELNPSFAFDSPFLQARWGEGLITIQKGSHKLVRDFR